VQHKIALYTIQKIVYKFVDKGRIGCMEVEELSSLFAHIHYEETCVICDQLRPKGIHLCTSFICVECERDLIHTETNDPKYKYFLKQLKKITTPEIFS